MKYMKKFKTTVSIFLICILLTACSIENSNEAQGEYTDSDAIYKIALQYIVAQINKEHVSISNAIINRIELVDSHIGSTNLQILVYALEYAYSIEGESGFLPGVTSKGSPYLFIKDKGGAPQLVGIKFTKDILSEGGFSTSAKSFIEENCDIDLSKHSTESTAFQPDEIEDAIRAAENYYSESTNEDILLINTWFDEECYQNDIIDCMENSLYGMDEAANRNDLIILYSDLYSFDSDAGNLLCNWKTIMIRDNINSPWRVVTSGY